MLKAMSKTKAAGRKAKAVKAPANGSTGAALVEHLEARWPQAFTQPQERATVTVVTAEVAPLPQPLAIDRLLRSGHVMSMLGINRKQLEKFIACGLLHPRRVPDPHRMSGRNREKRRGRPGGLIFLLSEVAGLTAKLPGA